MNLSDEQVKRLACKAEDLRSLQDRQAHLEDALKTVKGMVFVVESEDIPALMDEFGLESLTLKDGTKLSVKPFVAAHISKDHEAEAFQWLQDHGYGDIIKERTVVNVHPSTLKAWAKERVENGDNIPDDLFGVYVGRKAVLK